MSHPPGHFRELTQSVSATVAGLRSGTPEVMKAFNDLGRAGGQHLHGRSGLSLMFAASAIAAFEEFSGGKTALG